MLSTFDTTGYGQHADYVFGWKGDALQRAMDANGCFSATCGNQKSQDISVAKKCVIPKTVHEEVDGCKSSPWLSICFPCYDFCLFRGRTWTYLYTTRVRQDPR